MIINHSQFLTTKSPLPWDPTTSDRLALLCASKRVVCEQVAAVLSCICRSYQFSNFSSVIVFIFHILCSTKMEELRTVDRTIGSVRKALFPFDSKIAGWAHLSIFVVLYRRKATNCRRVNWGVNDKPLFEHFPFARLRRKRFVYVGLMFGEMLLVKFKQTWGWNKLPKP